MGSEEKWLIVILVVAIRLGCLNHAILTHKAILASGVKYAGWIANRIDPSMQAIEDYIQTLSNWLGEHFEFKT